MDWVKVVDKAAPAGWQAIGFDGDVGDHDLCGNGWNGYADGSKQAQLMTTLKGQGRATVEYRDCWKQGFVGLYVNGKRMDTTGTNNGDLRIYRCIGCVRLCWDQCISDRKLHSHCSLPCTYAVSILRTATS